MSPDSRGPSLAPPAWFQSSPGSERDTLVFSSYVLRGGNSEAQLTEGETILGRSRECGIVIDSPLVSRRHARLIVKGDDVLVHDLGSRNGVLINGVELNGSAKLAPGDRFTIGELQLTLMRRDGIVGPHPRGVPAEEKATPPEAGGADASVSDSAFDLLRNVADKALAIGSHEELIRLLGKHIKLVHESVLRDNPVDTPRTLAAASYAIRIAVTAGDVNWAVLALEMLSRRQVIPAPAIVDELYSLVKALRPHHPLVREYARCMGKQREELSPTDRFALKRLEGLERLIALQGR